MDVVWRGRKDRGFRRRFAFPANFLSCVLQPPCTESPSKMATPSRSGVTDAAMTCPVCGRTNSAILRHQIPRWQRPFGSCPVGAAILPPTAGPYECSAPYGGEEGGG